MGKHLTREQRQEVVRDRYRGLTSKEIAEKFGIHPNTVQRIFEKERGSYGTVGKS